MRLVLFDVDGTLLLCGRQVRAIFGSALREVFGETGDLDGHDFSGKTDPQIVLELLGAAGRTEEEISAALPRMRDLYTTRLGHRLDGAGMTLLPSVREVLDDLSARDDLALGLLTGNWRQGAAVKLSRLGLAGYFGFGAFGDDGAHRPDLLPAALERAGRLLGRSFAAAEAVVVGDSVHDVSCARAHGATAVAVATGWTAAGDLAAAGADAVLADLAGLPALLG